MNNDSTYYFIILRFLPESRKENYTSQRCSVFEKRANNLLALTATGKHLESLEGLRSAREASFFTNSYRIFTILLTREKYLYIYIFSKMPLRLPLLRNDSTIEIRNRRGKCKKGKIRRRSENKRRKGKG